MTRRFGMRITGEHTRTILGTVVAAVLLLSACSTSRQSVTRGDRSDAGRVDTVPARADLVRGRLLERFFTDGSILQMQQRYDEAIVEYRRALRFDTLTGAVHYALASCYEKLGRADSALLYARRAVEITPENIDARILLADQLMSTGEYDQAVRHYEAIIRLDPANVQAHYMIAYSSHTSDPWRAISEYEQVLRYVGSDSDILYSLTDLYLQVGNLDGAIDMMKRIVTLGQGTPELYMSLMTSLVGAERYTEAGVMLDDVLVRLHDEADAGKFYANYLHTLADELDLDYQPADKLQAYALDLVRNPPVAEPDFSSRFARGWLLYVLGTDDADSILASAFGFDDADPLAWIDMAERYLQDQQSDRLSAGLVPAEPVLDADARIPLLVAEAFERQGQLDTAERHVRHAIRIDPAFAPAWNLLGRISDARGRHEMSREAFDRALEYDPANPDYLGDYAFMLASHGIDLDYAIDMARSALAQEPENTRFLHAIGLAHHARGEYRHAIDYLELAVSAGGASAEMFEHLADAYLAIGNQKAAFDYYSRAVRIKPDRPDLRRKLEAAE